MRILLRPLAAWGAWMALLVWAVEDSGWSWWFLPWALYITVLMVALVWQVVRHPSGEDDR